MRHSLKSIVEQQAEEFRIKLDLGMEINNFQEQLNIVMQARTKQDIANYRIAENGWRPYSSEIVPVSHFLSILGIRHGTIRKAPQSDCDFYISGHPDFKAIEVTAALARAQIEQNRIINKQGSYYGFALEQDDEPKKNFKEDRNGYALSTNDITTALQDAIDICIENKREKFHQNTCLLVAAPLDENLCIEKFCVPLQTLVIPEKYPFKQTFIVDKNGKACFRLKTEHTALTMIRPPLPFPAPADDYNCCT